MTEYLERRTKEEYKRIIRYGNIVKYFFYITIINTRTIK